MSRFSPSDAALEGFRLTRERPGVIAAWAGFYLAGLLCLSLMMIVLIGPQFVAFVKAGKLQDMDVEALSNLFLKAGPKFLLIIVFAIFLASIQAGAIFRMIMRPDERRFAYLRIGADELRLTGVNLILFVLFSMFLAMIGPLILPLVVSVTGQPPKAALEFGAVVLFAAVVWVFVRLSLAAPATFAEGKISLLHAWRMTRGHYWSLLGMIVLSFVFYLMIWVLVSVIGAAFVALAGGSEALSNVGSLSPTAGLAAVFTFLLQLVLPILQAVMLYAPIMIAYQRLAENEQPPV